MPNVSFTDVLPNDQTGGATSIRAWFAVSLVLSFGVFVILILRTLLTAMTVKSFHRVLESAKSEWIFQRVHFMLDSSNVFTWLGAPWCCLEWPLSPEALESYSKSLQKCEEVDSTQHLADIKSCMEEMRQEIMCLRAAHNRHTKGNVGVRRDVASKSFS